VLLETDDLYDVVREKRPLIEQKRSRWRLCFAAGALVTTCLARGAGPVGDPPPWLPNGHPFVIGMPASAPPPDFYPADATKAELESWLSTLDTTKKAQALGPFSCIVRGAHGLEVVPYSRRYRTELEAAAPFCVGARPR